MTDNSPTMRERLAIALIQVPADKEREKAYWLSLVDAVLLELQRPSPEMLKVGATLIEDAGAKPGTGQLQCRVVFVQMIRSALSEKTGTARGSVTCVLNEQPRE